MEEDEYFTRCNYLNPMKSYELGNKWIQTFINLLINAYVSAKTFDDHKVV